MRKLMHHATVLLLAGSVSACALMWKDRFRVVYDDSSTIVLQYDPIIPTDRSKMQAMAEQLCARFGKGARYSRTTKQQLGMGLHADFYDCIGGGVDLVPPVTATGR